MKNFLLNLKATIILGVCGAMQQVAYDESKERNMDDVIIMVWGPLSHMLSSMV